MYGKSTLKDRLTVPKDGSNSTSGIIDAGDSYYLGGNRWIHNQGGNYCTAVGYYALQDNTTGSFNSAMGYAALYGNETGSSNSAMGYVLYVITLRFLQLCYGDNAYKVLTTLLWGIMLADT